MKPWPPSEVTDQADQEAMQNPGGNNTGNNNTGNNTGKPRRSGIR